MRMGVEKTSVSLSTRRAAAASSAI